MPTNFKNEFVERLCQQKECTAEISKFEGGKIRARNKCIQIINQLNAESIDIGQLRLLSFTGIPEGCPGLRALVWRILLEDLSPEPASWNKHLEQNYLTYEDFKRELIVKP